jgi:hypothetical protein
MLGKHIKEILEDQAEVLETGFDFGVSVRPYPRKKPLPHAFQLSVYVRPNPGVPPAAKHPRRPVLPIVDVDSVAELLNEVRVVLIVTLSRWVEAAERVPDPVLVILLHLFQMLDRVLTGLVVDDFVMSGAEENEIGVLVALFRCKW